MTKKFFTPTRRVSDIIGMATKFGEVFTIQRIMEDYEIGRSAAYNTLQTLQTIEFITVRKEKNQIIIEMKK